MFNPGEYRPLFPVTKNQVYLNHAATSPYSTRLTQALDRRVKKRLEGNIDDYQEVIETAGELKNRIATLINASPEQIVHTRNTSEGLNIIAQGLPWKTGDRILLYDKEFPANVWPFLNLRQKGVQIDFFSSDDGRIFPEIIERNLHEKIRLLSLSFVQFLNGFKSDLKAIGEICRERNILFIIDGIQGVGVVPISVKSLPIDALSCGMHKWLMSPQGTGFLYLSPELQEKLTPRFVSWLSVETPWDFFNHEQDLKTGADVFEYATYNSNGIIGANAAVGLLHEVGIKQIFNHVLKMGNLFALEAKNLGYSILSDLSDQHRSGITLFSHREPDRNELIFHTLRNEGISISLRERMLRLSPHFYNDESDIGKLLDICRKFA